MHVRQGRYYFRRGVPADAQQAFDGKGQVWTALRTTDLRVARNRLQREVDNFETRLASVRGEVAPAKIAFAPYLPSKAELEIRVRSAFDERQSRVRPVNRSDPASIEAAKSRLENVKAYRQATQLSRHLGVGDPPTHVVWQAEALCEQHGWSLPTNDDRWFDLIDLVSRAQIENAERELQVLEGSPEKAIDQGFLPERLMFDHELVKSGELQLGPPVMLQDLFIEYVTERNPAPATVKSFKAKVAAFEQFLGHGDARKITKQDISRWKDFLLDRGRSDGGPLNPKSVRATYLSAIRVTLKRGFDSGQLPANVAAGISVAGRKRSPLLRPQGFTDEEANQILRATLKPHRETLSLERRLARRWLPWLLSEIK